MAIIFLARLGEFATFPKRHRDKNSVHPLGSQGSKKETACLHAINAIITAKLTMATFKFGLHKAALTFIPFIAETKPYNNYTFNTQR